ncbi:MAG: DUF2007 domain-containing protein [Deltaproteobacteria bacterium]|nr:DUF2007 domain-containing protein [Deltaproteobacteria bacterium]
MATMMRYVDVYSPFDEIEANIIENLLDDYDIEHTTRPTEVQSEEGVLELMISVEEDRVGHAKKIITDAINNGVISPQGGFTA